MEDDMAGKARRPIEKKFKKLCDLFYSNIPLFIEKYEVIMNNPMFYNIRSPQLFFSGAHIGNCYFTLEKMLLFWKNESCFSGKCNCGGKTVTYRINISNLSGYSAYKICLKCGKIYKKLYDFNTSFNILLKYKQEEAFFNECIAIGELIKHLQDPNHKIDTSLKDDYSKVPLYITHSIWQKDHIVESGSEKEHPVWKG